VTGNPKEYKAGYVAIIGKPNVGKSTLMNQLLDFKLSITSPKPQTTRHRVIGIMNRANMQIIFLDTPGIVKPKYRLHKAMTKAIHGAIFDANALIFLVDILDYHPGDNITQLMDIFHTINPDNKPVILLINKIDRCKKSLLLPLIENYNHLYKFTAIIPISALTGDGLDKLKDILYDIIPNHPPYYDSDIISEHPERFFVAELVREQIFRYFKQEIPYTCEVMVEQFKEREIGKNFISAVIYTERNSQKSILIGKNGSALKEIGIKAREEIESLLSKKVFLELRVKVIKDWRKDTRQLKRFGY
jgi:GTP-binding protein Era